MLSRTLYVFIQILYLLILARILMSWFRPRYRTSGNGWFFSLEEMIWRATEPFLAPIRNLLPATGMFDLSPLILLLLVRLVGGWLVAALASTGL